MTFSANPIAVYNQRVRAIASARVSEDEAKSKLISTEPEVFLDAYMAGNRMFDAGDRHVSRAIKNLMNRFDDDPHGFFAEALEKERSKGRHRTDPATAIAKIMQKHPGLETAMSVSKLI